ncbi:hypothetical protein MPSEU_000507300 [Mayamaea pseudoterrestris]|nr:hypothetical protein MPSEU_000507300 [Mayamaea pseudoterrestris]
MPHHSNNSSDSSMHPIPIFKLKKKTSKHKNKSKKDKSVAAQPVMRGRCEKENFPPPVIVKVEIKKTKKASAAAAKQDARPANAANFKSRKSTSNFTSSSNRTVEPVLTRSERRRIVHEARRAARSVHSDRSMQLSRATQYRCRNMPDDTTPLMVEKLDFSTPNIQIKRFPLKRKRD